MMFKCSIRVLPLPISALSQYNSVFHTHNTRRSKFIHSSIGGNEATYRTFCYRGAYISSQHRCHARGVGLPAYSRTTTMLAITFGIISQNVSTDISYFLFKNLLQTHTLAYRIPHCKLTI